MENHLNIEITEPYAKNVLQDLVNKNAIKILEDDAADYRIPDWQKEEVRKRIKEIENSPFKGFTPEEFEKMWDEDEKI